jgi:hypothetical protein
MEAIWQFALKYPAFLVVAACGFVLSLVILRIKRRYVKEGVLFRRSASRERVHHPSETGSGETSANNSVDLEIAVRKFHDLGLEDGDLGICLLERSRTATQTSGRDGSANCRA